MLPTIWGKSAWDFLHLIILDYPNNPTENDKIRYYNYLFWFQQILPCSNCRNNLQEHLKYMPITSEVLASRNNFIKWSIDLHNVVNASIGKPILSYDDVIIEFNKLTGSKKCNSNIIYIYVIVILIVIFVLIIFFIKKN